MAGTTPRPSSGTTTRPNSGSIPRSDSGGTTRRPGQTDPRAVVAAWLSAPASLVSTEERARIAARLGVTVDALTHVDTQQLANEIDYEWASDNHKGDAWLVGE